MTTPTHHTGLPAYLCLASRAERILAYGHAGTLEEAHTWCRQARLVYLEYADQAVLAIPEEAEWFGAGRSLTIAFIAGWVRTGFSWQAAEPCWVRLNFDKVPRRPTSAAQLQPGPDFPPPSLLALGREFQSVSHRLEAPDCGAQQTTAVRSGRAKTRVLLVSEDVAIRALLAPTCDVREAAAFADALLELAHSNFDVVIAHHRLGAAPSGIALLGAIRNRWPRMRRVLCAEGALELRTAIEAGVAHHVVQHPLDRDAFMAAMATPRGSTL